MKNKSMQAVLMIIDHSKMSPKEKDACHKLILDLASEKYFEGLDQAYQAIQEAKKELHNKQSKQTKE